MQPTNPFAAVKVIALTIFMAVMVGCASLGVPTPQTFNERLAVSVATVTGVRQTAASLVTAGKITPADAQNVQAQADTARAGLDVARQLSAQCAAAQPPAPGVTTPVTCFPAEQRLQMVSTVLTALQTYLNSKGALK